MNVLQVYRKQGVPTTYHLDCYTAQKGDLPLGVIRLMNNTQCAACKEIIEHGNILDRPDVAQPLVQQTLF